MIFTNTPSARIDFDKEVPYIAFPVLSELPFLKHGFSTRLGGVSGGWYASLNFGELFGEDKDSPENILENYNRMAKSLGVDVRSMVISQQVHKTNIRLVREADRGKGLFFPRDYSEVDGLITDTPGITLVTKYADCVPLYFADPVRKAIGLAHSGWRGTVAGIGRLTVEEMGKYFGSTPADLIAVIGPSICGQCYEIGEEVALEFEKAFPRNTSYISKAAGRNACSHKDSLDNRDTNSDACDKDSDIPGKILTPLGNGKYLCDLWAANRAVLLEAGLKPENINTSGVCTCCHDDLLFSHRKTGGKRGSLAAFLALKE